MRRLAVVFALIALISTAIRVVTPERVIAAAVKISRSQEEIRRKIVRACLALSRSLRPLLPRAN